MIKNAINVLQTSLNDSKTGVDGIDTTDLDATISSRAKQVSVDALGSHAITVRAIEPAQDIDILPVTAGVMYKGHINGIMSISGVAGNSTQLLCAIHSNNAPVQTLVKLINGNSPVFQSETIKEGFTCTSLRLQAGGVFEGTIADLAIDYTMMEGIREIESSP